MKAIYLLPLAIAATACSHMDELLPQGGIALSQQLQETNKIIPSRADASFNGMFTKLGAPGSTLGGTRPDDYGFIMMSFSNDIEAADVVLANSGYNWFSACGLLTSRNADYANPYVRYAAPYNTIASANENNHVISGQPGRYGNTPQTGPGKGHESICLSQPCTIFPVRI